MTNPNSSGTHAGKAETASVGVGGNRPARRSRKTAVRTTSVRASDRQPVAIDASSNELRALMTEQCRRPEGGFATYYFGSYEQFMSIGLPERVLACGKSTHSFRLAPGGHATSSNQEVDAFLRRRGDDGRLELEIHWSDSGPRQCGHPAITEIARMALCGMGYWTQSAEWNSPEVPTAKLIESELTSYDLSPDRHFNWTPQSKSRLLHLRNWLWEEIMRCELVEVNPQSPDDRGAKQQASHVIERARKAARHG